MPWPGWEDFDPNAPRAGTPAPKPSATEKPVRSKWTAVPCIVTAGGEIYEAAIAKELGLTGIRCGSKHEAARLRTLVLEQKAGLIRDLTWQRAFPLQVAHATGPITIGTYIADAVYYRGEQLVVEDAKGKPGQTPIYRWKKKHMEAQYGLQIVEV